LSFRCLRKRQFMENRERHRAETSVLPAFGLTTKTWTNFQTGAKGLLRAA
jgi:hypothetical protein